MRFNKICIAFVAVLFFSMTAYSQEEEDKVLLLNIGNKNLRDKVMAISPDNIFSAKEGKAVSFTKMITEMKDSRFVYVGESHNSMPMHDVQLEVVQALHQQDKNLSIGLEMFPVTGQEVLNKWSLGLLTEDEFIQEAEWYVTWNFNFNYYRKIFLYAKENKIPIYALNAPRTMISAVRMKGWEALSDEQKLIIPKPDLSIEDHRKLIQTIFGGTELPHQMQGSDMEMMFEGLYRAQSAWDEVMAYNAVESAKKDGRRMAILAGSGHLLYNLGINYRAFERTGVPFKTVVCLEVPNESDSVQVSRTYADYIWGLKAEEKPVYPSVGLSFKVFDGIENLVIESDPIGGVSLGQDIKKGDVVLDVDGKAYTNINTLRTYLSRFTWGDEVKFRLLREAAEVEVTLKIEIIEHEEIDL
ncbi:MAG: ChaN family lipoprotein [Candidatus Aminicenantes bacterium]|nr:ChaN family lipoprotein [Candidatus Aminicenantes bacterium]